MHYRCASKETPSQQGVRYDVGHAYVNVNGAHTVFKLELRYIIMNCMGPSNSTNVEEGT